MDKGFKFFKMKVGENREDDCRRMKLMRDIVGYDVPLVRKFFVRALWHARLFLRDRWHKTLRQIVHETEDEWRECTDRNIS